MACIYGMPINDDGRDFRLKLDPAYIFCMHSPERPHIQNGENEPTLRSDTSQKFSTQRYEHIKQSN